MADRIEKLLLSQENRKYVSVTIKKRVGDYEQVEVTCSESSDTDDFSTIRERLKTELEQVLKDAIKVYKEVSQSSPKEPTKAVTSDGVLLATDKQKQLIKKLSPNINTESLTMEQAKKIIDRLLNEKGAKK